MSNLLRCIRLAVCLSVCLLLLLLVFCWVFSEQRPVVLGERLRPGHYVWVTALSLLTPAHNLQSVQTSYDPPPPHPHLYTICHPGPCILLALLCPDILALPSYLPCPFSLWDCIHCCHNGSFRRSSLCPYCHSLAPLSCCFLIAACSLYIISVYLDLGESSHAALIWLFSTVWSTHWFPRLVNMTSNQHHKYLNFHTDQQTLHIDRRLWWMNEWSGVQKTLFDTFLSHAITNVLYMCPGWNWY